MARPVSYGTFNVLCASVAQESAASHPRTRCRGDRLGERVERAGVNVARLEYDDRRLVAAFVERRLQRVSTQPPLIIDRDLLGRSQPEIAKGEVDGVVPLGAHDDANSWSAVETALGHVPAGIPEDGIPTGGQP